MKTLCIFHGNCADGFAAAWVVRKALGEDNVEFFPGVYQTSPPDVAGRDVILVDFSYKRPIMDKMINDSASVVVLDHHKTAAADLEGLICADVVFDMNRSGARITWDYFFPDIAPPPLLLHIEDRDLWRFNLPFTREIQANVFSYPYTFSAWDELMNADPQTLITAGTVIERKHFKDIAELVKVCRRELRIGGLLVPAASLPYTLSSDAGHLMATEHASRIGVCYWDTTAGRVFSLRSTEDGPDVSEIAKQYGGGGHAHAAGFTVPFSTAAGFEVS